MVGNQPTYIESIRNSLHELMAEDPRVVILGEDVLDPYGGAFKATRGLSTQFPTRVITTPISEASIVGVAVGLALRGLHPVAEIMFGDFITLAADQIVNHAAKYQAMYNRTVDVPLVVRTPMGGGRGYGPTHSQSIEKLFFGLPDLDILAPSHFHDAGELLKQAVRARHPVLFIENKLLYPLSLKLDDEMAGVSRSVIHDGEGYPTVVLKNYPAAKKPDLVLISYGGTSRLLEPVLIELRREEVWVTACLPGRISPLASAPILECAQASDRIIVIEDGPPGFGWGAEVVAQIYETGHPRLAAPIKRIGAQPTVIPASKVLEEEALVSKEKILATVFEVLQW